MRVGDDASVSAVANVGKPEDEETSEEEEINE